MNKPLISINTLAATIAILPLIFTTAMADPALHLKDGTVVCSYPSVLSEAHTALVNGDNKWFQSTGCDRISGKAVAIHLDNLGKYVAQIRVPQLEKTVFVSRFDLLMTHQGKVINVIDYQYK